MTNPSELLNYSDPARVGNYAAPEEVSKPYIPPEGYPPNSPPPPAYMQQGGVIFVPQPYSQTGQIFMPPNALADPPIAQIRDWLPWSIINMFIGWLLMGILPLIFSLICRSRKKANNASGARTMSTLALVFNILVTLAGVATWIGFIVAIIIVRSTISAIGTSSSYTTRCYYYYC